MRIGALDYEILKHRWLALISHHSNKANLLYSSLSRARGLKTYTVDCIVSTDCSCNWLVMNRTIVTRNGPKRVSC